MDRLHAQEALQNTVTYGSGHRHEENPGELVARCFRERSEPAGPVNPLLNCASIGFTLCQGDWLGVVITPWFMDLVLLPGGGNLWGDIPAGQRRYVELPQGTVAFTAAEDSRLGAYQHAPLVATVASLPDMAAAVALANQVMLGICGDAMHDAAPPTARPNAGAGSLDGPEVPSRRGFLRRLAGKG
jgi:[NiFe] hydrogenase assembly HybE family chaperone